MIFPVMNIYRVKINTLIGQLGGTTFTGILFHNFMLYEQWPFVRVFLLLWKREVILGNVFSYFSHTVAFSQNLLTDDVCVCVACYENIQRYLIMNISLLATAAYLQLNKSKM